MSGCTALVTLSLAIPLITVACGGDGAPPATALRLCPPPAGVSASPRSIAETVALVNALPRPMTVACFLESLDRPLHVNATRSFISLQPAVSGRSPRIFVMFEGMSLSIVPEGSGSKLIEFGEFVTPERTLKGEIKTPLLAQLNPADPFLSPIATSGVNAGMGTTCRTCHSLEERSEQITFADAFASTALRPDPRTRVALETVAAERAACPDDDQGERCAILRALFDHGEVLPREFPDTLPTIFD